MSQELTTRAPGGAIAQTTSDMAANLLAIASDPSTDVAKASEMFALFERMKDRAAKEAFNEAMVSCQAEMPRVTKDGKVINHKTGALQSRYATLEAIDRVVRPIYEQHGFSISVSFDGTEGNKYIAKAVVRHRGGHSEEYRIPLALDQSGAKNDTQGMGSTASYARRYLLCSIFNIITEGEDTDGQQRVETITEEQALTLHTMLTDQRKDIGKILARASQQAGYEITSLNQIPARLHPAIMQALGAK